MNQNQPKPCKFCNDSGVIEDRNGNKLRCICQIRIEKKIPEWEWEDERKEDES